VKSLLRLGRTPGADNPHDDTDVPVDAQGDTHLAGQPVFHGWLVTSHDGTGLTAADLKTFLAWGIAETHQVRAQIRLPFKSTARMVFAGSDENGKIRAVIRMPGATGFSRCRTARRSPTGRSGSCS
jgi:hypothetical protein